MFLGQDAKVLRQLGVSSINTAKQRYNNPISLSFELGGNADDSDYASGKGSDARNIVLPHLAAKYVGDNTMASRVSVYADHIKTYITRCAAQQGNVPISVNLIGQSLGGGIMSQVMVKLAEDPALKEYGQVSYTLD